MRPNAPSNVPRLQFALWMERPIARPAPAREAVFAGHEAVWLSQLRDLERLSRKRHARTPGTGPGVGGGTAVKLADEVQRSGQA